MKTLEKFQWWFLAVILFGFFICCLIAAGEIYEDWTYDNINNDPLNKVCSH